MPVRRATTNQWYTSHGEVEIEIADRASGMGNKLGLSYGYVGKTIRVEVDFRDTQGTQYIISDTIGPVTMGTPPALSLDVRDVTPTAATLYAEAASRLCGCQRLHLRYRADGGPWTTVPATPKDDRLRYLTYHQFPRLTGLAAGA